MVDRQRKGRARLACRPRVEALLRERKFTRRQIAKMAGCDPRYVSHVGQLIGVKAVKDVVVPITLPRPPRTEADIKAAGARLLEAQFAMHDFRGDAMLLSDHFSLDEFLFSETARRMGRPIVPGPDIVNNLRRLCLTLLEPIRVKLARPLVITSGYRPDWLNVAIGGSKTSNHMQGFAADIKVVGMSSPTFARWIENNWLTEGWPIDQCILEFPPNGWVHLGIAEKPRGQFLTASSQNGRTVYTTGLHG